MEQYSLYTREGDNDAFTDLLFNVLLGFAFMFFIAFILIKPEDASGKIDTNAEFLGILKLSENGSRILVDTIVKVKDHVGKFHDSINFRSAKLTDILQEMIQSKQEILPIFVDGKWIEIDTANDLKIAKNIFG